MVTEGLSEKEAAFALAHSEDTDAELLIYVRRCAAELGHSPHVKEIVGWQYLMERFGTWERVLKKAYLPMPRTPDRPSEFLLIREETEIQKANYRRKKALKKQKAAQRRQADKKRRAQRSVPPCAEAVECEAV